MKRVVSLCAAVAALVAAAPAPASHTLTCLQARAAMGHSSAVGCVYAGRYAIYLTHPNWEVADYVVRRTRADGSHYYLRYHRGH